jgi:hypothetical protein
MESGIGGDGLPSRSFSEGWPTAIPLPGNIGLFVSG